MKIAQIVTGIIPIMEIGKRPWGAVEKIISEYKSSLESLGHTVDICYLDDIKPNHDYDIVHIHMGNLALEAFNRGIKYVFSLHDHHVEYYGKNSDCYKTNLAAIKGSIFSITHAEHLLEYFDTTHRLFYLSHGVNTNYFTPSTEQKEKNILMVANNGLAGDYKIDRKGFKIGIETARLFDIPITIAGAEANKMFFELSDDIVPYDNLTVLSDNKTEKEILELYKTHSYFLHPSSLEAGHPNLTLLEAASCCLPIVGTCKSSNPIVGMYCMKELTVQECVKGMNHSIANYQNIVSLMKEERYKHDWNRVCDTLSQYYETVTNIRDYNSDITRDKYINAYNS